MKILYFQRKAARILKFLDKSHKFIDLNFGHFEKNDWPLWFSISRQVVGYSQLEVPPHARPPLPPHPVAPCAVVPLLLVPGAPQRSDLVRDLAPKPPSYHVGVPFEGTHLVHHWSCESFWGGLGLVHTFDATQVFGVGWEQAMTTFLWFGYTGCMLGQSALARLKRRKKKGRSKTFGIGECQQDPCLRIYSHFSVEIRIYLPFSADQVRKW